MIDGILPVDKPLGWTSHDVVARVRRVSGQRSVGHAGTLDPLATGVLLLVMGRGTRFSSYLMETEKTYCAEVVLGVTTVTDDAEAPIEQSMDASMIRGDDVDRVLDRFVGTVDQTPPMYAAVRHEGERLYKLARAGKTVEIAPRRVTIFECSLVGWAPPRARMRVRCSSGTYIRALARDIGRHLGVGAYLHALRRVRSGSFGVDGCVPLDRLQTRADVASAALHAERAVLDWPARVLDADEQRAVEVGSSISAGRDYLRPVRLYDGAGRLIALAKPDGAVLKPFRVMTGGE